jgi:hypothetical protein
MMNNSDATVQIREQIKALAWSNVNVTLVRFREGTETYDSSQFLAYKAFA